VPNENHKKAMLLAVSGDVSLTICVSQSREGAVFQEGRDVVTISELTDRIYQNTPQEHIITNVVSGRKMRIQKYNFPDTGE
jgi:D-hexose-6-phosphate mutarotase